MSVTHTGHRFGTLKEAQDWIRQHRYERPVEQTVPYRKRLLNALWDGRVNIADLLVSCIDAMSEPQLEALFMNMGLGETHDDD